jgi:hypothetical protein
MSKNFRYVFLFVFACTITSCEFISEEKGFKCEGKVDNLKNVVGHSIDEINEICGEYDKRYRDISYAYILSSDGEYDKRHLQVYSAVDTARTASLVYRYYAEDLDEGKSIKDYKPFKEHYEEIKEKYNKSKDFKKAGIDNTGEGEYYYVEERWEETNQSVNNKVNGQLEINLQKRIVVDEKPVSGKNYKRVENIRAVIVLEAKDSIY